MSFLRYLESTALHMKSTDELQQILARIDGRGYKAYRDLKGVYRYETFELSVDHVQGDPFAAPSRLSARISYAESGIPPAYHGNKVRKVALADFLTRSFADASREVASGRRGTGKSGLIEIDCGAQEVLERNSVVVSEHETEQFLEVRFTAGLPADGRRVLARVAVEMLLREIPAIIEQSMFRRNLDAEQMRRHVLTTEDQEALREQLGPNGLVAFVADDSVLPRRSGIDDRPLVATSDSGGQSVVKFVAPTGFRVQLQRPNSGSIGGMGIPEGVTLIVGGGFHGKSTLLRALERGVYNHVPGDGRECVVTSPTAVKIRAEDGRHVSNVDISPFINNLPFAKDTQSFSTPNASGSTSQAANIMEALEMQSSLLLIDEDTSATNFIIRDSRMQELVAKTREPITPFIDRARELFERHGTSTVMVVGGSGDYFDVADHVLLMDSYVVDDATIRAREIAEANPSNRKNESVLAFGPPKPRFPSESSFDSRRGRRDVKIDTRGLRSLVFGSTAIDLSCVEQLVEVSQTRAIGKAIHRYAQHFASQGSLEQGLRRLEEELDEGGLDLLSSFKVGNLARPRAHEIAAAINRMRTLVARPRP